MAAQRTSHVTIQRHDEVPLPVHKDGKLFCCPFCTETQFKQARKDKVEDHLEGHHNRAVVLKGMTIHRCGLGCKKKLHYHCSYCPGVIFKRNDFMNHLEMCKMKCAHKRDLTLPLSAEAPRSSPPTPAAAPQQLKDQITTKTTPPLVTGTPPPDIKKTMATLTDSRKRVRRRAVIQKRCPFCQLLINRFNLKRHIERKHSNKKVQDINARCHLTGEIIDKENGIYVVLDVFQGHSVPVHVQLKTWGTNHHFLCEHSECQINMDVTHLCIHIRSATYITSPAQAESLSPFVLDAMVSVNWLGHEAKEDCLRRQELAHNDKTPLSVHTIGLPETKKCISVYEPTVSPYSRVGRVMVVYDSKVDTWTCPCTDLRHSCIHTDIAKWHLFQTQGHLFRTEEKHDCSSGIKIEDDGGPVCPPTGDTSQEMVPHIQKIEVILPEGIGHPHRESPGDLVSPGGSTWLFTEDGTPDTNKDRSQTESTSWCMLRRAELNSLLEENRAMQRELEEYRKSEGVSR